MRVSLERLYSREFKIKDTIKEINNNELSRSGDKPIEVSYNKEYNVYVVIDGHHRVIEAYLSGKKSVEAVRNIHIPSCYNLEAENNVKLMEVVKKEESKNVFEEGSNVPLVVNHLNKLKKAELKKAKKESLLLELHSSIKKQNPKSQSTPKLKSTKLNKMR